MDKDDEVLKAISQLLVDNKINFWVCHGTLLGIIRENRLLPWDRDIDLAVWNHETDKNVIAKIFENEGYKQEYFFADVDSLHFYGNGKNIDINFFKKSNGIGSWQGAIASEGFYNKIVIHFAHILHIEDLRKIELPKNYLKKFFYLFFIFIVFFLRYFYTKKLKVMANKAALGRISYIGYSYPLDLLNFKEINYKGIFLQVPINSEKCLELTYGPNWRVPKKDYVWHKDANNLIQS
jgi:phosphorylcholine metabolism protein LicD